MSSHPKSIVLVEDEAEYAGLLGRALTDQLDCPVHIFTRPLAALDGLARADPAVVVTDYLMPDIDGVEFMRRAAALAPAAAFILMTGSAAPPDEVAELPCVKASLAKPFGGRTLLEQVLRVWPADLPRPSRRSGPGAS